VIDRPIDLDAFGLELLLHGAQVVQIVPNAEGNVE